MQVEIWSDVICPWCFIGKRRFEKALAGFSHRDEVKVVWRSFELDPSAPAQYPGTLEELLVAKYDVSQPEAAAMNARVTQFAQEEGLEYRLSQARPGNTFDVHRLLHFAHERSLGDRAIERVMHAYFSEGLSVGDREALLQLATELGLPEQDVRQMFASDAYASAVRADEARASSFDIHVVPFFLFDEKIRVSGAESIEAFSQALHTARG